MQDDRVQRNVDVPENPAPDQQKRTSPRTLSSQIKTRTGVAAGGGGVAVWRDRRDRRSVWARRFRHTSAAACKTPCAQQGAQQLFQDSSHEDTKRRQRRIISWPPPHLHLQRLDEIPSPYVSLLLPFSVNLLPTRLLCPLASCSVAICFIMTHSSAPVATKRVPQMPRPRLTAVPTRVRPK